jgi:hypothetical protein
MALRYITFGLLLALFLLLISRNVSSEPYLYDEADYMYAASLGFAANWSDTPSMPIADFVRAGLHRDGRQALSERIRSGTDVLFYRHFHGPLFYYFLIPLARLRMSEHDVRLCMLAIPCGTLAVIYFCCPLPAFLAALLFLTSYSVIASTELAPHQLFALCSVTSLLLLLKAIATGRRAFWYASVVAAGLAFCTLEVAFVLILTLAICGFVERIGGKCAVKSIALFLGTVLLVWPAAILRLSFVKSYAAMAYLALTREAPWGHVGFIDTWRERIFDSPIEWLLIALAVALGFRNRRFYPMRLFVVMMVLATLRILTSTPRYSLTFMPALDVLAGLTLLPFLGTSRRPASLAVVALAVAGLYASAWFQVARQPHNSNPRSTAVLSYIHQNRLEDKKLLVPQVDLPGLHYYFPSMRLRGYSGAQPNATDHEGFTPDAILNSGAKP